MPRRKKCMADEKIKGDEHDCVCVCVCVCVRVRAVSYTHLRACLLYTSDAADE